MTFKINTSKSVTIRSKKILMWGPTGSRKTESVLRYFPNVLIIDCEANASQCVDVPEIPEFLHVQTKDTETVREILNAVANGELRMPNGNPVETVAIDSITILWSVRQEVGANLAEKRAAQYNKSADDSSMTMRDWTIAKRPLRELNTALANLPVRYMVLIAREKDLFVKRPGSTRDDDMIKVGVTPDCVKGTDYEMNLGLQMGYDIDPKTGKRKDWFCEVSKVQGSLGQTMPMGKRFAAFPFDLIAASANIAVPSVGTDKSEVETANDQTERETAVPSAAKPAEPRTGDKTFGEVYAAAKAKDKTSGGTLYFDQAKQMMNGGGKTPQETWDAMKL